MLRAVDFFKALCDETRLRCSLLLEQEGELCVCELTQALDLPQPKISRHLAQLRQSGFLTDQRKGQWVYYRLNPNLPKWALDMLAVAAKEVIDHSPYREDRQRLHGMAARPMEGRACR